MLFKSKSLQGIQHLHLQSEIVINVSWMSTALELFIVTPAKPCHHLYLYLVTFFEISRLILCTHQSVPLKISSLKDHSKIKESKGNTINSKCMKGAQKWWVRRGQCSANSWLNISVYFSISLPCAHMFSELFACHRCDWQWGAKPVSRVACLLSRNSSQHDAFTLVDYTHWERQTHKYLL